MTKRRWKPAQARSMQEAIHLCLRYAEHHHNRGVERVGDLIGTSHWTIYKWAGDGSIPSRRIRPFEFACGCTYITEYLAASANKLLVDIPTGRRVDESELLDLQNTCSRAVAALTDFYRGSAAPEDVLHTITEAMKGLASHRANVPLAETPELGLFEGGEA
jgi:hypothetical protein